MNRSGEARISAIIATVASLATGATLAAGASVGDPSFDRLLASLLSHSVVEIGAQQARETTSCIWLDAREHAEFAVSHVAGARHVGYEHFGADAVADIDRTTCVIVYCSIGYRSEKIAEKLRAQGFVDARNLYGGIFEWVNRGYPIVAIDGTSTARVHAYGRAWGIWLERGEKVY